ncbi:SWIM zinc finger family protein [Halosimplex marinum]|uniref:SWIM zinc finger family protein n=1 Tax=Halosimplex marinum TaxID=3396620 RepID=UPI003F54B03C
MSRAESGGPVDFPDRIDPGTGLTFPPKWTLSTSWQRAQRETGRGGAVNAAERMVWLSEGDEPHRVTWALTGRTLVADCDCRGYQYREWCAHVARLWWRWCRGRLVVEHVDTGREYRHPPAWLDLDADPDEFTEMTGAEMDAYLVCEIAGVGVREYADHTDRAPGTVGNLLRRARDKVGGVER